MKLLLLGAGHGHLHLLKKLKEKPLKGVDIILISDKDKQYYSGMLSAYVEGIYTEDELSFDVKELCDEAGVTFINERVLSVHKDGKLVKTEKTSFSYDLLSINLGSNARKSFTDVTNLTYVKPLDEVIKLKERLKTYSQNKRKLLVIGGGASGAELALTFKEAFKELDVTLISRDNRLGSNFNRRVSKLLLKSLREKDVHYSLAEELLEVREKSILTSKGERPYDELLLSTGFKGPEVTFNGFPLTEENFLLTEKTLEVCEGVFALGDSISFKDYPKMPRTGVFAIKEAPLLVENIRRKIEGQELLSFTPQKHYLQLINTSKKTAILSLGPLTFKSKRAWALKDNIDRYYMEHGSIK